MHHDSWLGVELRHLAALAAVARTGSFGEAARQLGYSQPAISQQIATLERLVGMQLVERPGGPKSVSITDAGRVLLRHSEAITARLAAAQADLAALADGTGGPLRVGTYQSAGERILPAVIRRYRAAWPRVDVRLTESSSESELLDAVERGQLDLTFTVLPLREGPFDAVELLRDPLVIVAQRGHPLGRRQLSLPDLAGMELIGYRNADPIEAYLRSRGIEPRYVFRSDDNGTIQSLAGVGVAPALMGRLAVSTPDPAIEVLSLGPLTPPRLIALAWHRDRFRSRAAVAFVDEARNVCRELTETIETAPAPV